MPDPPSAQRPVQAGDLPSRLLFLAPEGGDLGQEHLAHRVDPLPTGLAPCLHRFLAQSHYLVPGAGGDLHPGKKEHVPDNPGLGVLVVLGDQLSPHRARLVETIAAAEQPRERSSRALPPATSVGGGSLDPQPTVEQVMPDATGACERHLADRHEAADEQLRLGHLLGEHEPCFRIAGAVSVVGSCCVRKLAEEVRPHADLDAGLGKSLQVEALSCTDALPTARGRVRVATGLRHARGRPARSRSPPRASHPPSPDRRHTSSARPQ